MTWRSAFLLQARSDFGTREFLNTQRVEYCHQLHYLQMASEKLAKGFLTPASSSDPPQLTHAAFVRCLQVIKGRPDVRRMLNVSNTQAFIEFVDSLLPLAEQVQRLAPKYSGVRGPNPEYPWQPTPRGSVTAPAEFEFPQFAPQSPHMDKLIRLLRELLRVIS